MLYTEWLGETLQTLQTLHRVAAMSNHLITTAANGALCPRCRAIVLLGVAEGLTARVDLTPINRAGEIAALLANLQTYSLSRTGLVHRDAGRIGGSKLRGPVLAQHQCGRQIQVIHRATTAPPVPAAVADDRPPY